MQNHIQHNKDERTQFLRKYTSHFIERVVCERRVGDCAELQHIDPPNSSGYNSISFSFSWAAQPGAWGPSLYWDMVLIPASSLQQIKTSCRRGYIIIWRPPTSCERHNSHSIQPVDSQGYLPIPSTGCTCYLLRCISYFDSSAGGQYVTFDLKTFFYHLLSAILNETFSFYGISDFIHLILEAF